MDRALSLSSAAAVSLVCGLLHGGCGLLDCQNDPTTTTPALLGTKETIADVAHVDALVAGESGRYIAVGPGGLVIVERDAGPEQTHPTDVDLHAVRTTADDILVVGAAGTLLRADVEARTWTTFDPQTDADLWDVATFSTPNGDVTLAVGDGVVVLREPFSDTWTPIAAPEGGWGMLRKVVDGYSQIHVVGLAGAMWTAEDPRGPWVREDTGTTADLFAGAHDAFGFVTVVGAGGTLRVRQDGPWAAYATDLDVDLVDLHQGVTLTADGRLYEFRPRDDARYLVFDVGRPTRALHHETAGQIRVVGPAGFAALIERPICE